MRQVIHRSHQDYGTQTHARRLQEQTCEQVHAASTWENIRIGYELLDVESVSANKIDLVQNTLMARAVAYWSFALQVRRAQAPLKMDRLGAGCFKYEFDTEYRCQSLNTPTCGGVSVPDKYLKFSRACQQSCVPSFACSGNCISGNSCACDVDLWQSSGSSGYCCSLSPGNDCPDGCSVETAEKVGSGTTGGFVCEAQCSEAPEGAGAENEDLHIFVTIQDSTECQNSDVLLAFATSCGVDQCDRPIFGTINFCPQKLENGVDMLVSTAVHELAHVLVFSNVHFRNFRYSNGTPMIPRAADDDSNFQNEITYTCSSTGYEWGASPGNYKYVDMSPNIVNAFSERGYSCQCPIGTSSITAGCFYPSPPYLQVPSCVVRMTTPTVLAEARSFFDCPTLDGAELENQEGNGCSIIGSHWEQRVFAGEIMSPVSTERLVETYVSRVSLAVFQDSGWYKPNMSAADPVVKGVHWGYQQGCSFATAKCVDNDVPVNSRLFCTDSTSITCSLDRKSVQNCEISGSYTTLPSVLSYTTGNNLGLAPEMDYCPHFAVTLSNRVCTSSGSSTVPYTNVNFMREVFSNNSRCFMSTLHADAPADGGGVYTAPNEFTAARPVCYEVECASDGASYTLKVTNLLTDPISVMSIGTCVSATQTLTMQSGGGSVSCVEPAEVCSDLSPRHVRGDPRGTSGGGVSTSAASTTVTTSVNGASTTSTSSVSGSTSSAPGGASTTTGNGVSGTSASSTSGSPASSGGTTTSTATGGASGAGSTTSGPVTTSDFAEVGSANPAASHACSLTLGCVALLLGRV